MSSRPETRPGGASPAPPPTTPFAPGQENIWTDVLARNKADAKARGDVGRPDAALFVLGATGSGKTTLLRRILYGGVDGRGDGAPPKPGEGMEYHYARRARGGESDRKDVAHVWEISGGRAFAEAICSKESVFFGARQVTTGTALICIDLSKPEQAVPTLEYFLSRVRLAVDRTFDKLRKRGSRLPEQLVNRHKKQFKAAAATARANFGDDDVHDSTSLDDLSAGILTAEHFSGVQIVVACTKADLHRREDAEPRRVLSRALRRLAHFNGASLFYVDCSGSSSSSSSVSSSHTRSSSVVSRRDELKGADVSDSESPSRQFAFLRSFVNHCVFVGADKPFPKTAPPCFDHLQNVRVVLGQDGANLIGAPRAGDSGTGSYETDVASAWRTACAKVFSVSSAAAVLGEKNAKERAWVEGDGDDDGGRGDSELRNVAKLPFDAQRYAEPEVDLTRARKTEELEAFKKQQQMLLRQGQAAVR
jgi:dynein light intermediate chain 2